MPNERSWYGALKADTQAGVKPVSRPYGAAHIADTDLEQFKNSMLEQLRQAGIPLPDKYDIFPQKRDGAPETVAVEGVNSVKGESLENPVFAELLSTLQVEFKDHRACSSPAFLPASPEWRIFAAIHETVHHVDFNWNGKGGEYLHVGILKDINETDGQDLISYNKSIYNEITKTYPDASNDLMIELLKQDNPLADKALVSFIMGGQIKERIADAGAALYILSNYGDTAQNRKFLDNMVDIRTAHHADIVHDSS